MPRQKKDFLLNPVVISIIVIIAMIIAFNFYQNMTRMNQIETKIEKIENKIAAAEAEQEQLKEHIENSSNNKYIEEVAREKLGLVKPGEKLLIPIESENKEEKNENDNEN